MFTVPKSSDISTPRLAIFAKRALHRQPVRDLQQEHVSRRSVSQRGEIAAETEVAAADRVGAVLVPDEIHRRSRLELPPHDGAPAKAAEVEVGIAVVLRRHVVRGARTRERDEVAIRAGGDERLREELERQTRARGPLRAYADVERVLIDLAEDGLARRVDVLRRIVLAAELRRETQTHVRRRAVVQIEPVAVRVGSVVGHPIVDVRLERKLLARVVAGAESEVETARARGERTATRLAIVERLHIPSTPPVRVPVVLPLHVPVAVAAVCELVAAVVPVLILAEPPLDVARVLHRAVVDVLHHRVRHGLVGAGHESEVVDLESGRERLHLNVRTPAAGLFAEHDASAESAERRARGIVVKVRSVGTLIVVRGWRLGERDRRLASVDARRAGQPFEQPILVVEHLIAVDAGDIGIAAEVIELAWQLAIDGGEEESDARVALVEFLRAAGDDVVRQRLDLLPRELVIENEGRVLAIRHGVEHAEGPAVAELAGHLRGAEDRRLSWRVDEISGQVARPLRRATDTARVEPLRSVEVEVRAEVRRRVAVS